MIGGSFHVGQRLTLKMQAYRIFRDIGDGNIAMENLVTGLISQQSIADLLVAWKVGDLIIGDGSMTPSDLLNNAIEGAHLDAFRQIYTQSEQDLASARLAYVERLKVIPRTLSVMTPIIQKIWNDKKMWKAGNPIKKIPHFTTVLKWINAYLSSERDIRSLVERHDRKGNSVERHHEIVQTIVSDLIQTRYLSLERPTIKAIMKEATGIIKSRNTTRLKSDQLKIPTYKFYKDRIHDLAPFDVHRARYGLSAAQIKFRAATAGVVAVRPLERAAMDHSRMDVLVVDESTGLPLGRPWITVIIDEYSRYILGYYLGFEEPSNVSMVRALRNALSPKDVSPDVKCLWDAWGIIETLAVDNGLEFHGRALEAGAGRYGITIQFCPRRKPWYKGKIERFFGTMNTGLLVDMKGKTFSSVLLKGDYDPAKHAVMTLETLRRVVQIWIVDVYHQEIHSVLGMSPAEAWNEAIYRVDRYLPPSSLAMEAAFSASCRRELTHKGIEFDSLFYNSRELGVLRELHGSHINVEVRTCDDDLGSVVVVSPDQKTLLKIPALNIKYAAGLTRWQHKVCKRFQRRVLDDDAREITLLYARQRIKELIEQDMQVASRKTRNAQQRFLEDKSSKSVVIQGQVEPVEHSQHLPVIETGLDSIDQSLINRLPNFPNDSQQFDEVVQDDDDVENLPVLTSRRVIKRVAQ